MRNRWYTTFKAVLGPWVWILNRTSIRGQEHIPDEGAVMLVSNHQAVMDSLYKGLMLNRQLTFPAKKEYFTTPGLVGAIQKFFFSSVGQIPIDRDDKNAGDATVEAAKSVFANDDIFAIYPEGTRSPDGRVYKGRTGMARIAMQTGVKVVPVAMINTGRANPIGSWILRPWVRVHIRIGSPIDPHAWAAENGYDPQSREVMRPFTDHLMHTISELGGYPYVDMYASEVKKSLAAGNGYPAGAQPGGELETPAP